MFVGVLQMCWVDVFLVVILSEELMPKVWFRFFVKGYCMHLHATNSDAVILGADQPRKFPYYDPAY